MASLNKFVILGVQITTYITYKGTNFLSNVQAYTEEYSLHDLMEIMLESIMVTNAASFSLIILAIRRMAIILAPPMVMVANQNSVSPVTTTRTSIPRFWLFFVTKRRSTSVWQEYSIPRD